MPYSNADRQARDAKEMAELEKLMQEGENPTQSPNEPTEGSPKESVEGITEQSNVHKEPAQDLEYWKERALSSEKRFNVSKPKYDSNIFQLRKENTQLQSDRIELSKQLNTLKQSIASNRPDEVSEMLSKPEVVNVLGQETADTIKKTIVDTNARVDRQEKRLADKELKDDQTRLQKSVNDRYEGFVTTLRRLVPDQVKLNNDPGFLKYLKGADKNTGVTRFYLLREAEKAGQAERVASFFNEYKGVRDKAAAVAPVDSVNKHITPSTTGSNADENITVTGEKGEKISAKFIDKFFFDVNKGVYKGRYKEQMAMQARIDAAYMSDNITN